MDRKFCKNCKHFRSNYGPARCTRKEAFVTIPDDVHGDSVYQRTCNTMRSDNYPCGPDAKLYDPKVSWLIKFENLSIWSYLPF